MSSAQYTARGDRWRTLVPGATITESWDNEGQLKSSTVGSSAGLALRSATLGYDARGKMTSMSGTTGARESMTAAFSGLGHLVRTGSTSYDETSIDQQYTTSETFALSPLGDITASTTASNYAYTVNGWLTPGTSSHLSTVPRDSWYHAVSGRLTGQSSAGTESSFEYDAGGNTVFTRTFGPGDNPSADERASFYDAAGQVRAVETQSVAQMYGLDRPRAYRLVFEEYAYDALGRRVLVRARKDCSNPFADYYCQLGTVRRTIWDGSAELGEIQQPGSATSSTAEMENDGALAAHQTVPAGETYNPDPFFGAVVYTYGLYGTDQPVTVTRLHYGDWKDGARVAFGPLTIAPMWDPRGRIDARLFPDGTRSYSVQGVPVRIASPVSWFAYYRAKAYTSGWHGSLLEDKADASGLLYRRNRSYDPMTGRFTQEDPIGLAGGINAYGFAAGDPVTYSDPFGLCPYEGKERTNSLGDCPDDARRDAFKTLQGNALGRSFINVVTERGINVTLSDGPTDCGGRSANGCSDPYQNTMVLNGKLGNADLASVVAHETQHFVNYQLQNSSFAFKMGSFATDEAFAYAAGFTFLNSLPASARGGSSYARWAAAYGRNNRTGLRMVCKETGYANCP